jgi:hypothetical protein
MKAFGLTAVLLVSVLSGSMLHAQQAMSPGSATGQCVDGSYTSKATQLGACWGHKGVKEWYGKANSATAPGMTPNIAAAPAASSSMATTHAPAMATTNDGHGQVWVNGNSKVYHCPGNKWYGKTKVGSYMSEAEAKAKGYHADHGKTCPP